MRQFTQKGLRIEQLSVEAKLIYSAFCVFSIAGLILSVVLYAEMVGPNPTEGVDQYYAGEEPAEAGPEPADAPDDGPMIELPDDTVESEPGTGPKLISKIGKRKLLEVTHFHLFTLPVFLLIISHLFMLCRLGRRAKVTIIGVAVTSTAVHLAAPWVIRWGGAGWSWLMPVTGTIMGGTLLVMTAWPAVAMWRKPPPKSARNGAA